MPKTHNTRKRNRLDGYDYSNNGAYHVTICTKKHECIFGKINNICVGAPLACARKNIPSRIELSNIGKIIDTQWQDIPNQFDGIELDQYIIMPNHMHGILIINKRAQASGAPTAQLGQIIRSFKSKCVINCLKYIQTNNLNLSAKIWQRNYHDHIIRNNKSLQKAREYIINNPANWAEDEENKSSATTQISGC